MDNKVVPSFAVAEAGEHCHVQILDIYFKKVPHEAIAKNNFCHRPLSKVANDPNAPWLACTPMVKNMLQSMVPIICEDGGVAQQTNHSLCATGASEMFRISVPEKGIQTQTGHMSLEGLRVYKHATEEQQKQHVVC